MKKKYSAGHDIVVKNAKGEPIIYCWSNYMARKVARALNAMEPKEVKPAKKKQDYSDLPEYGNCRYCENLATGNTAGKCRKCKSINNGTESYWDPKK